MTRDDTGLLVVTSGIASQFEDLGSEVLKNGGEVDGSTSTNTLSVVALPQEAVDTTNGKGETGLGRAAMKNASGSGIWMKNAQISDFRVRN